MHTRRIKTKTFHRMNRIELESCGSLPAFLANFPRQNSVLVLGRIGWSSGQ
jgi:hypothetical protein